MRMGIAAVTGLMMAVTVTTPAFAASTEYVLDQMSLTPSSFLSEEPVTFTGASAKKDPWIAAGLSAGAPVLLLGSGLAILGLGQLVSSNNPILLTGLGVINSSALGLGAGQLYAGDTLRGALVGLGFYAAFYAGTETAAKIGGYGSNTYSALYIGAYSAIAYTAWALYDSYQTAIRKNNEL